MGFDEDKIDTISVRAAFVGWQMALGWTPTTEEVEQIFDMSHAGAQMLMQRVSRIIPITCEEIKGNQHYKPRWYAVHRTAINTSLTATIDTCRQEDVA